MEPNEIDSQDLLTLREASKASGRAVQTLRAWIRAGKLEAGRQAGNEANSPVLVKRGDLLGAMQRSGIIGNNRPVTTTTPNRIPNGIPVDRLLGEKDARIEDLHKDKAELRQQISRLEIELRDERQHSRELATRVTALERELVAAGSHGRGVIGWLAGRVLR